uniref:Uncharacterized protein n=1 Tax=Mycena chlorophos TaxID=658473 RepID=A0ABQ0M3V5_MYCCL|nr:predicted protein [Mycena chlorophos]
MIRGDVLVVRSGSLETENNADGWLRFGFGPIEAAQLQPSTRGEMTPDWVKCSTFSLASGCFWRWMTFMVGRRQAVISVFGRPPLDLDHHLENPPLSPSLSPTRAAGASCSATGRARSCQCALKDGLQAGRTASGTDCKWAFGGGKGPVHNNARPRRRRRHSSSLWLQAARNAPTRLSQCTSASFAKLSKPTDSDFAGCYTSVANSCNGWGRGSFAADVVEMTVELERRGRNRKALQENDRPVKARNMLYEPSEKEGDCQANIRERPLQARHTRLSPGCPGLQSRPAPITLFLKCSRKSLAHKHPFASPPRLPGHRPARFRQLGRHASRCGACQPQGNVLTKVIGPQAPFRKSSSITRTSCSTLSSTRTPCISVRCSSTPRECLGTRDRPHHNTEVLVARCFGAGKAGVGGPHDATTLHRRTDIGASTPSLRSNSFNKTGES